MPINAAAAKPTGTARETSGALHVRLTTPRCTFDDSRTLSCRGPVGGTPSIRLLIPSNLFAQALWNQHQPRAQPRIALVPNRLTGKESRTATTVPE